MTDIHHLPVEKELQACVSFAESYGRAATMLAHDVQAGGYLPHKVPIGALALHCIELSLKAVLIKNGMSPDEIRKEYSHGIRKLFKDSGLDWSDIANGQIEILNDIALTHALRYRHKDKYIVVDPDVLLPFMEMVFQRCLAYALPGYNRTASPAEKQ